MFLFVYEVVFIEELFMNNYLEIMFSSTKITPDIFKANFNSLIKYKSIIFIFYLDKEVKNVLITLMNS